MKYWGEFVKRVGVCVFIIFIVCARFEIFERVLGI